MTAPTRRALVLGGAAAGAAVLVLAVGPRFYGTAETSSAPSNRTGRGDAQALPKVPVVDLKLERLESAREALAESNRDPFRFRPKPAPPPPAPVARRSAPTELTAPVPTGPPPPPPIAVKFFGLFVVRGERVAAFTDARGNTFHGKEGDIIEGRYRVLRIGTDSVDLAYLDGRGRQTIRLTGQ
jgi:hypothetical protein